MSQNKHKNTGLNRDLKDKFYTSNKIANICIEIIKNNIDIKKNDLCIEPSAGTGSFINGIKLLSDNYIFYDIEPENNSEIIKQDYLKFDPNTINKQNFDKIHIIGNPPFGRQSSYAIKFIKKSCEFCDSISFILPKSFKKNSLQKHFNSYFHLIYEYDIPQYSFIIDNKPHNVPCVFQIWIKKQEPRQFIEKIKPNQYSFVKKEDLHDISVRRVGGTAGNIDRYTNDKSIQSHYFIKFNNILSDKLYNQLQNINFECKNNTCGPRSISKQELIYEYNNIINKYNKE